jgi:hypothetical protein
MTAEYRGTVPKRGDRVGMAEQSDLFEVVDANASAWAGSDVQEPRSANLLTGPKTGGRSWPLKISIVPRFCHWFPG